MFSKDFDNLRMQLQPQCALNIIPKKSQYFDELEVHAKEEIEKSVVNSGPYVLPAAAKGHGIEHGKK